MTNPHEVVTVKCAQCGTQKGETNHWHVVLWDRWSFCCIPFVRDLMANERPICGHACSQKELEAYMNKQRDITSFG